jgi:hypothetical protein
MELHDGASLWSLCCCCEQEGHYEKLSSVDTLLGDGRQKAIEKFGGRGRTREKSCILIGVQNICRQQIFYISMQIFLLFASRSGIFVVLEQNI